MIALVFVSFLLIGISTNFQITESSYYYHELRLDRKESQLQRAISYEFINNINPVKSQIFRDKIFKISDISIKKSVRSISKIFIICFSRVNNCRALFWI